MECGEEMGARKGSTHTMKNHIRVRDIDVLNVKFCFCEIINDICENIKFSRTKGAIRTNKV